ncbi:MAG: hypothetical protein HRT58_03905 [Crocinitomicaceae bacterium]|nr:hypothetical protein [Flavobacteriales bacterium]NQZ34779.1 hypothetical protein [Crocinitomicaceae bacterium]
MKAREEEILEQLNELCRVNEYSHFDVSLPTLKEDIEGYLCFEHVSYSLEELQLTLHDIERLERLGKISIVHKFRFKELSQNEISRISYSIFVPSKTEVRYGSPSEDKWKPMTIIALTGGLLICIMAILMVANNANIVGFDTTYGGGYGYHTLTPKATLCLGIFILLIGVFSMPKKRDK